MRLASVSLVRNEADVIEAFVRYHVQRLDRMLILCHFSQDNTLEILQSLASEGLAVEVLSDRTSAYRQGERMTEFMREAAAGGADWVLPLDADEFVVTEAGSLRDAVGELPDDRTAYVAARGYVPTARDDPDEPNPIVRIRHRVPEERWFKVFVPKRLAADRRFHLVTGSHAVVDTRGGLVPREQTTSVVLAHFPYRDAEQMERKILGGWPTALADPSRRPSQGTHWRDLFEQWCATQTLPYEKHQSTALVDDPLPVDFELRYPMRPAPPALVAARTAELLAEELLAARTRLRPPFVRRAGALVARLRRLRG